MRRSSSSSTCSRSRTPGSLRPARVARLARVACRARAGVAPIARPPRPAGATLGILAGLVALLVLAGCGGGGTKLRAPKGTLSGSSPAVRQLQRTDLAIVGRGLLSVQTTIRPELAASRSAWPAIAHGLPARVSPATRLAIARAITSVRQIATPRFISYAGQLSGTAAAIAGLELSYEELALRGWTLTRVAADYGARAQAGNGSLQAADFLRANAALYIGCVYDAHYNLSLIGEDLKEAYAQLGGARAFGSALRPAQVEAVARFYAPAVARLAPRPPSSSLGS
jgi:hypothetical protein